MIVTHVFAQIGKQSPIDSMAARMIMESLSFISADRALDVRASRWVTN